MRWIGGKWLAGVLVLCVLLGCSSEIDVPDDDRWLEPFLEHSTNIDSGASLEAVVDAEYVDRVSEVKADELVEPHDANAKHHLSPATRQVLMSALQAQLLRQHVIANNLANLSTFGFKRRRALFGELAPRSLRAAGTLDESGQYSPVGIELGQGCEVVATQTEFSQGTLQQTGRNLDLAIEGLGFLQVADPDGEILYTRAGVLTLNANGNLVVGSALTGRLLEPAIVVPQNTTDVVVDPTGRVRVEMPGQSQLSDIGQIQLAWFLNPESLQSVGENLYAQTELSGAPTIGNPGGNGFGELRRRMLEMSNVEVDHEISELADCNTQIRRLRRLLNLSDVDDDAAAGVIELTGTE